MFQKLIRRILSIKLQPALFMFNNVQYNNGVNARGYGVFTISRKGSIHAEVAQERRTVDCLIQTTGGAV